MNWNDVYKENIELDKLFYDNPSIDIINKNKLELLVEFSEFANETKCFKYWSNKTPNKDMMLEELADCFIMTLSFFNYLKLDLDINQFELDKDNINLFFKLYKLGVSFIDKESDIIIKDIFNTLLNLGYNLELTDNDMITSCINKINKNKLRIKDGY